MKTEDLQALGLNEEQIKSVMSENGKDLAKLQKEKDKLTTERDAWKEKAENAEETLKSFEGVDLETMNTELATWKQKATDLEKDYNKKEYDRDFADALKAELEDVEFSSESAKKAVMAEIKEAGLTLKSGKILGLSDLIAQIKENDASAFVDSQQVELEGNKAKFTQVMSPKGGKPSDMSKEDIMKIKDTSERQKAIAEHAHLFGRGE